MNTIPNYYIFIVLAGIFGLYGFFLLVALIVKKFRGNEEDDLRKFRPSLLRGS